MNIFYDEIELTIKNDIMPQWGRRNRFSHSYSTLNYSAKEHFRISSCTNELMCLCIQRANNGHIGCLDATDESTQCNQNIQ